ncbi:MAG: hypothetical protein ACREQ1_14630, partial [Woeseiaceae bacterium]
RLPLKIYLGSYDRPAYAFGIYAAAFQAKALDIPRISVIEFGVASGGGLVAMESLSRKIGAYLGVGMDVHGFDMGTGLPKPTDYRDLPYTFREGDYAMDEQRLRSRLESAELWLGPVRETAQRFRESSPAPIGFVSFDLDLYSSTVDAFQVFEMGHDGRLPRVMCYFDDVLWPDEAFYSEATGELLAIDEFNRDHPGLRISQLRSLAYTKPGHAQWLGQIYVMHDFQHPGYCHDLFTERLRQMRPV